jgi:alpha-tubulin suppressor-like RCC1 family protein
MIATSLWSGRTGGRRLAAAGHLQPCANLTTMVYIIQADQYGALAARGDRGQADWGPETDVMHPTPTPTASDAFRCRRARRAWGRCVFLVCAIAVVAAFALNAGGSAGASASGGGTATGSAVYRWGVVGNNGKIAKLELNRPTVIAGITGRVVQIATSNSDGYALTSAGQVYGWGVNSYGELGDGHVTPYQTRAVKVGFPSAVKITSLANPMPFDAGLAIDSAGHAWAWGLNGADDLCLPSLIYTRPHQVPLSDVTLATGARTHALFDSNGTVYACGSGDAGELGNGSTASAGSPTPVTGLPSGVKVTALVSSWEGSGALLANGAYYDWGYNAAGQLGDGSTNDSAVPVAVRLPGRVLRVFQGGSGAKNGQTIAILKNGSVWMWGDNDRGQLGTGSRTNATTPVKVHVPNGVSFVMVTSGGFASYAIDTTGRLWAWGDNRDGQLGIGASHSTETLPVDVGIHLTQVSSTAQDVAGVQEHP